jgi:hypothetical protein
MRSLIIIALATASLLAAPVQTLAESSVTELKAKIEREPVNTIEPIYRAYLESPSQKFTFLVPGRYRPSASAQDGGFQMRNMKDSSVIAFSLLTEAPAGISDSARDAYREILSTRYVNGKFIKESTDDAAGHKVPVFDVQWIGQHGLSETTRAMFIPTEAGVLELTVTAATTNFPDAKSNLSEVSGTLTASVNGKLVVHHVSGRL